jgi:uronate dehydrogenase
VRRVLLTGASGNIGSRLRKLLPPIYPELVLSDLKAPADLDPRETFVEANLARLEEVERACEGVEGIVHLGGYSVEGPWEAIHQANIVGCYTLFEAARRKGVKRVIFASSNHAVGFYPRTEAISNAVVPRPDGRYGVSKVFGEALGALYAYKHGIGVMSIRIGNVDDRPVDARRLAIWLAPADLVQLIRIGLEHPDLVYEVIYGVSDNARSWYDNSRAVALGYRPEGKAEDFRDEALAADAKLAKNPVAEFYQGGPFCGQEFSADADKLRR